MSRRKLVLTVPDILTLTVEFAEGVRVDASGTTEPPPPDDFGEQWRDKAGPDDAANRIAADAAIATWPAGECPKHRKPFTDGRYGPYCTAKDDTQPKGYCSLKPGVLWNGKRVVA